MTERHLERLLGKVIVDVVGDRVGRIEEVRAEQQGDEWVVVEYLIGLAAVVERLSAWTLGLTVLRFLGAHKLQQSYRVPWYQLDWTDPDQPRLRCTRHELKALSHQMEADTQP